MNLNDHLPDAVMSRVEAENAARTNRLNAQHARDVALMAGVCPDCAGSVRRKTRNPLQLLQCDQLLECTGCGVKHFYRHWD